MHAPSLPEDPPAAASAPGWMRWVSRLWPWLWVVGFAIWATFPLWSSTDRVFAGKLSSDNVVSAWFYDYVARAVLNDRSLDFLVDFNHPNPWRRAQEFPSIVDALLVAPFGWMLGWPQQWGASQAFAVLINGLGTAALARAMGARGAGVAVAGTLGVVCRPVWKSLVMARMNAAFPGLALLALAAALWVATGPKLRGRAIGWWVPIAALVGAVGALGATVYPPYLALMVPVGVVLLLPALWRGGWARAGLLVLAVGVGLALSWNELSAILGARDALGECGKARCPDMYSSVPVVDLWQLRPDARQGLSLPGSAASAWVLAPLVLLHRRRGRGLLVLLWAALLVALSIGPCPTLDGHVELNPQNWPVVGPALPAVFCVLSPLNDFERLTAVGGLLAAALGGLGISALTWKRPWWMALMGVGLGVAVCGHAQWLVISEAISPSKWHDTRASASALYLDEAGPGPAVELPFDRRDQFLSAMYSRPRRRVNPLRPVDHPPSNDPFIRWLYEIGRGRVPATPATRDQADRSGVRFVVFDAERCGVGSVPKAACGAPVLAALQAVLGKPVSQRGIHAWELGVWTTPAAPVEGSDPGVEAGDDAGDDTGHGDADELPVTGAPVQAG